MEKQRYYITLQSGTTVAEIRDVKGEASYDFEIETTPVQAGMIRDLFNHCVHGDYMMWMRDGHTLWTDLPDEDNDEYDDNLREIYRMIYRYGTPKTKQDLEQMGLVKLLGLDRSEPDPQQGRAGGPLEPTSQIRENDSLEGPLEETMEI
ncbi:hypothetical protein NDK47_05975 [Brevibacillus ruminantium]|uniref:Hydrolase n=1 Tax=Brevibacillus ruminantium TaxID=2950604 RepID=A0ABY4WI77_9BACL|nr:hypothetical protein [Brevibacillus ruminantium]USG66846.1 hypothetical protein NDK47_05975 [Brevibacillus ruminantium]